MYGDYFFEDKDELEADCRIGADGQPFFNGAGPCFPWDPDQAAGAKATLTLQCL